MNSVRHRPIFDTKVIAEHYTKKDGVPVSYVCTSAPNEYADYAADIFYRETPHPEFGNRYFAIYNGNPRFGVDSFRKDAIMIANADPIEELVFNCVEVNGEWHYSQHRHDFHSVGDVAIDGGRAYTRYVGNVDCPKKCFVVKDGKFMEKE